MSKKVSARIKGFKRRPAQPLETVLANAQRSLAEKQKPREKEPHVPTLADAERIAKAQAKRERKKAKATSCHPGSDGKFANMNNVEDTTTRLDVREFIY